ncbi:alpha/beta hydrolase-fold protein [Lactobacillus terrae]|uniref:carboxylesterase family protein n=1 Tax=Lactobacillus terrae TaxID=2269374 RepID=UPI000C1B7258|nr:alpha/beta hydrolase-fold protein [Lactobacillus terrae]
MKKLRLLAAMLMIMTVVLGACSSNSGSSKKSSSTSTTESFKKTDTNDPTTDPSLKNVLKETQSKFIQTTYKDPKTGVELPYNLYVPENYDKNKDYPLLTFIHDDSVTGQSVESSLTQGYGGVIWATKAEQKKHPSFVLVPTFKTSTIEGGFGQSGSSVVEDQVKAYMNLLSSLQKKYSVDKDRLYLTGQSMGGMTSFYLNSHYPDKFAATLYVSSQWDVSQLEPLKNQKFFYIVAGGDSSASKGQTDLQAMLKKDKTSYTSTTMDATWSAKKKNTEVNKLLDKNKNINMISWKSGTVLENSDKGMEHMASFDYGYTIPAVRDWLYNQSK